MLKIFVINLKKSTQRKEFIKNELNKLGLNFEIFPAVDGKKNDPIFKKYDKKKHLFLKGYPLLKGELGCFASHYKLWQKCLELNQPIVVLEDDIKFLKNAKNFLTNLDENLPFEFLYLFTTKQTNSKNTKIITSYLGLEIIQYKKSPYTTMGYVITPNGAKKFLNHAKRWFLPVDDYMTCFWINKVRPLGLKKAILTTDNLDTDIGTIAQRKAKKIIWFKLNREIYSLYSKIRRFFYNLKNY